MVAADVGGSSDPYVEFNYSGNSAKSEVGKGNWKTPTWNQEFTFSFATSQAVLDVRLMDHDGLSGNDTMGSAKVPLGELVVGKPLQRWYPTYATDGTVAGEVEISLSLLQYRMKVHVVKAEKLKADDSGIWSSSSDPFVIVRHGRQMAETKVIKENLNPEWNQAFDMCYFEATPIEVEVFDYDMAGDNDRIGITSIPAKPLANGQQWYNLAEKIGGKATGCGRIQLGFALSALNYPNWPPPQPPKPAPPPPPPAPPPAVAADTFKKELEEALARIAELEGEVSGMEEKQEAMEVELSAIKGDNASYEKKMQRMRERTGSLDAEVKRLQQELESANAAKADSSALKVREDALMADLARTQAELERAMREKADLEGQLQASAGGSHEACTGELEAELEKSKSLLSLLREARIKAARDRSSTLG